MLAVEVPPLVRVDANAHVPCPPSTPRSGAVAPRRRRSSSTNKENSRPRQQRIVVIAAGAKQPASPLIPSRSTPNLLRMRRLVSTTSAVPVCTSRLQAPETLPRSRSAVSLARAAPVVTTLGAQVRQRARSAPALRPSLAPPRPTSLGASLHFSSCAMLRESAVRPLGLPAAKVFFDPATGREITLRCGR